MTSPDASVAALIETGRRFERMWLGSRERMVAIHPMTQIPEEAPFRDRAAGRRVEQLAPEILQGRARRGAAARSDERWNDATRPSARGS